MSVVCCSCQMGAPLFCSSRSSAAMLICFTPARSRDGTYFMGCAPGSLLVCPCLLRRQLSSSEGALKDQANPNHFQSQKPRWATCSSRLPWWALQAPSLGMLSKADSEAIVSYREEAITIRLCHASTASNYLKSFLAKSHAAPRSSCP